MTTEKSWVMTKDRTDEEHEESRKLVLQVRCGILEGTVFDLETRVNWWLEKSDQYG